MVANFHRVGALRAAFDRIRPTQIISFGAETNKLSLLASAGRWPVVVAERCDPNFYLAGRICRSLRALTYPRASPVVFQTAAAKRALSSRLNSVVIGNPIFTYPTATLEDPTPFPTDIVEIGHLTHQNGFDILLDALARLPEQHGHVALLIFGEGKERAALEAQIRRLELSSRVDMPGIVRNPAPFLRQSKLFVLSSRYEGYPNALCETLDLGLPAIACDCPSGSAEIILGTGAGLLVPSGDAGALAAARAIGQLDLAATIVRTGSQFVRIPAVKLDPEPNRPSTEMPQVFRDRLRRAFEWCRKSANAS